MNLQEANKIQVGTFNGLMNHCGREEGEQKSSFVFFRPAVPMLVEKGMIEDWTLSETNGSRRSYGKQSCMPLLAAFFHLCSLHG